MRDVTEILAVDDRAVMATDSEYAEARKRAITYLIKYRRNRGTSGRIAHHLDKFDFFEETIEQVVRDLAADGYYSDIDCARSVLKERRGRKAEGRRALQSRMQRLGIDQNAIETAFAESSVGDEQRVEEFFVYKRQRDLDSLKTHGIPDENYYRDRNKLIQAAERKGFRSDIAIMVLERLLTE
ncbi:MAG TPA: RecX family transcriptional regulator [Clostridiaceae bacterium]|nr:RecX family transcriptional regulator [Clostridiaceae bacterium]